MFPLPPLPLRAPGREGREKEEEVLAAGGAGHLVNRWSRPSSRAMEGCSEPRLDAKSEVSPGLRRSGAAGLWSWKGCFPKLCFLPSFQVTNQVSEGPPRPQRASAGQGAGGSTWPAPCRGGTMPPGAFPSSPPIQRLCLRVSFIPPACIAPSTLHLLQ